MIDTRSNSLKRQLCQSRRLETVPNLSPIIVNLDSPLPPFVLPIISVPPCGFLLPFTLPGFSSYSFIFPLLHFTILNIVHCHLPFATYILSLHTIVSLHGRILSLLSFSKPPRSISLSSEKLCTNCFQTLSCFYSLLQISRVHDLFPLPSL